MQAQASQPKLIYLPCSGNADIGFLTVAENSALPFEIQRVYWTYQVPQDKLRGGHAHYELEQLIFAVHGWIEFELEGLDGKKQIFLLDNPECGLYIPKLFWRNIKFSIDAVLVCLASLEYDEREYIRNYSDFKNLQHAAS